MASVVDRLCERGLINPPGPVHSTQYEVMVGSVMYGVADDLSDVDINGFCIPAKSVVFPHLNGEILGFGRQKKRFEQYQKHHINDKQARKTYDLTIYNIIKFFHLCMENNPNMLDCLFAPDTCIRKITKIGHMVRRQRRLFLHKGAWHRFKGYAYSQLHKARGKNPEPGSKRALIRERYGWDCKFGYHVVRLIGEVEQILSEGNIDLQRNREHLKAIRRGEISQENVEKWFSDKEKSLEKMYEASTLRYSPDEHAIKQLLLDCLEEFYGSLENCISEQEGGTKFYDEVAALVHKHRPLHQ